MNMGILRLSAWIHPMSCSKQKYKAIFLNSITQKIKIRISNWIYNADIIETKVQRYAQNYSTILLWTSMNGLYVIVYFIGKW
jgi:hypothetical protein